MDRKESKDPDHISHALKTAFDHIEDLYDGAINIDYRVMTGLKALDQMTNGFHRGDLIAVCGEPGVGKSSFALNLACSAATRYKDRASIMMFSTQSPANHLALRSVIAGARRLYSNIQWGALMQADWPRLSNSAGNLSDVNLAINDSIATIDEIVIYGRERKRDHKDTCLLILDSLDTITGENPIAYSDALVRLKQLARELGLPIIVTSAVRDKTRLRRFSNHDPLYTLMEKYADILMQIKRREVSSDAHYLNIDGVEVANSENGGKTTPGVKAVTVEKWSMEFSVLKNKNGPNGRFNLDFLPQFSRFIGI